MSELQSEWAFCLLKPDALERGIMGEIITRIERTFLRICDIQMRHKTCEWCMKHYDHVLGEPFFDDLIKFMTSCPIVGLVVSGPFAVSRMRNLVGQTCSWRALPGTIRGDYGYYPARHNCIHVSDNQTAAEREFGLFTNPETDRGEENAS